jgi:glycosyltransferase involved in cell wall biosynthesis
MSPLVSLLVPTYNRAGSLSATLPTVLSQEHPNLEILISDNGSSDDTEAVCRDAAARDSRIRYFRHERNIGLYQNHNFLIDQSRGDFICFFHDHDTREPNLVPEYLSFLQAHPDVGVVCSDWNIVDEYGRHLGVRDHAVGEITKGRAFIEQTIRAGRCSVGAPGAMIRRAALGDARFDEAGAIGFGDFVLWFRIAENWNVGHVASHLWSWTQEPRAQSVRRIVSLVEDYDRNLTTYCSGYLTRRPSDTALVAGWRRLIRRYIFWALVFEVGLHFRGDGAGAARPAAEAGRTPVTGSPTLFEIHRYQLTHEEFAQALERLAAYRTGVDQALVYAALTALVKLRMTWPLGWVTRHYGLMRVLLGLR